MHVHMLRMCICHTVHSQVVRIQFYHVDNCMHCMRSIFDVLETAGIRRFYCIYCVCACIRVCVCVWMCIHVYLVNCLYVHIHTYTYIVHTYVRICWSEHMYCRTLASTHLLCCQQLHSVAIVDAMFSQLSFHQGLE